MKHALIGYSRCWRTRAAFLEAGVMAYTCDLLPPQENDPIPALHMQMDVWAAVEAGSRWNNERHDWDFGLFHPMCTYLTVSAAWAFKDPDFEKYPDVGYHQRVSPATLTGKARRVQRQAEMANFCQLLDLPFPCVLENPASNFVSRVVGGPDQIIHPHQFGDDASKATGLWFNAVARHTGLPLLEPTQQVAPRWVEGNGRLLPRWANQTDSGQNNLTPGRDRWLERSATYPGIAAALGRQWGAWIARSMM